MNRDRLTRRVTFLHRFFALWTLLSALTVAATGAHAATSIAVGQGFALPGQEALVPVQVSTDVDACGVNLRLAYDAALLDVVGVETGPLLTVGHAVDFYSSAAGVLNVVVYAPDAPTTFTSRTGTVVSLRFRVHDTASPGASASVAFAPAVAGTPALPSAGLSDLTGQSLAIATLTPGSVSVFVPGSPAAYKVSYRACDVAVTTSGLTVSNAAGKTASLKIQRLKKSPKNTTNVPGCLYLLACPGIGRIDVAGDIGTFYTDAPVGVLQVLGSVGAISSKNAIIGHIAAEGRLGSVKVCSSEPAHEMRVESGGSDTDSLSVTLSGVRLTGLRTQQTVKKLSVVTKKAKTGVVDGVIGDSADSTATLLLAPDFGTISATAGVHAKIMAGYTWDDATKTASPGYTGGVKAIATWKSNSLSGEVHLSPSAGETLKLKGTSTMVIKTAP